MGMRRGATGTLQELMGTVRPEFIFHLASAVTGSRDLDQVWPTFHNNLASTVNLLIEATKAGCERIVLTGSMEVPARDQLGALPPSPYAAAKWASSHVRAHVPRAVRVPRRDPEGLHGLWTRAGRSNQTDPVRHRMLPGRHSHPDCPADERLVDWVYVDDVVGAHLEAARAPEAVGRSWTSVPVPA